MSVQYNGATLYFTSFTKYSQFLTTGQKFENDTLYNYFIIHNTLYPPILQNCLIIIDEAETNDVVDRDYGIQKARLDQIGNLNENTNLETIQSRLGNINGTQSLQDQIGLLNKGVVDPYFTNLQDQIGKLTSTSSLQVQIDNINAIPGNISKLGPIQTQNKLSYLTEQLGTLAENDILRSLSQQVGGVIGTLSLQQQINLLGVPYVNIQGLDTLSKQVGDVDGPVSVQAQVLKFGIVQTQNTLTTLSEQLGTLATNNTLKSLSEQIGQVVGTFSLQQQVSSLNTILGIQSGDVDLQTQITNIKNSIGTTYPNSNSLDTIQKQIGDVSGPIDVQTQITNLKTSLGTFTTNNSTLDTLNKQVGIVSGTKSLQTQISEAVTAYGIPYTNSNLDTLSKQVGNVSGTIDVQTQITNLKTILGTFTTNNSTLDTLNKQVGVVSGTKSLQTQISEAVTAYGTPYTNTLGLNTLSKQVGEVSGSQTLSQQTFNLRAQLGTPFANSLGLSTLSLQVGSVDGSIDIQTQIKNIKMYFPGQIIIMQNKLASSEIRIGGNVFGLCDGITPVNVSYALHTKYTILPDLSLRYMFGAFYSPHSLTDTYTPLKETFKANVPGGLVGDADSIINKKNVPKHQHLIPVGSSTSNTDYVWDNYGWDKPSLSSLNAIRPDYGRGKKNYPCLTGEGDNQSIIDDTNGAKFVENETALGSTPFLPPSFLVVYYMCMD